MVSKKKNNSPQKSSRKGSLSRQKNQKNQMAPSQTDKNKPLIDKDYPFAK